MLALRTIVNLSEFRQVGQDGETGIFLGAIAHRSVAEELPLEGWVAEGCRSSRLVSGVQYCG